jgi:hypothetical protein
VIAVKLTKTEFLSLVQFVRSNCAMVDQIPLQQRPVRIMVQADYLASLTPARLHAWRLRHPRKEFKVSLKLTVAVAIHQEMQDTLITGIQQIVLLKLDQAMVDYLAPKPAFESLQ